VDLDLGHVQAILSGAERVHYATIKRFTERFAPFGLQERVLRPSYGLAEATLYVATPEPGKPVTTARFDLAQLSAGLARPCVGGRDGTTELVSYGAQRACLIRIVHPETGTEQPAGAIGEIWVHGDNVAQGYWRKPEQSARTFGARITDPSAGTPAAPWLRTGDLGVISNGELYIMGRLKDLAIIELNRRGSDNEHAQRLDTVKREVSTAIWRSHNLRVGDLVLVSPGSIPITTSGKIRRSSCVELYRHGGFQRLDIAV